MTTIGNPFHLKKKAGHSSFASTPLQCCNCSDAFFFFFSSKAEQSSWRQSSIYIAVFTKLSLCYFERFYYACRKEAEEFFPIWIPSSGSPLRSWYPGLVYFKLFLTVKQRKNPLEECSSEATHVRNLRNLRCWIAWMLYKMCKRSHVSKFQFLHWSKSLRTEQSNQGGETGRLHAGSDKALHEKGQ